MEYLRNPFRLAKALRLRIDFMWLNLGHDEAFKNVTEDHLRRICPQVYIYVIDVFVSYPEIPKQS